MAEVEWNHTDILTFMYMFMFLCSGANVHFSMLMNQHTLTSNTVLSFVIQIASSYSNETGNIMYLLMTMMYNFIRLVAYIVIKTHYFLHGGQYTVT